MPKSSRKTRRSLSAWTLLALAFWVPRAAVADFTMTVEALMSNVEANHIFIPYFYGFDAAALSYTSQVNADGSFSFASDSGLVYLGEAFSLEGTGIYDAVADTYNLSSAGSIGAQSWTILGTATFQGPVGGDRVIDLNVDIAAPSLGKIGDVHIETVYRRGPPATSTGTGFLTDKDGIQIPNTRFTSTDHLDSDGKWRNDSSTFDPPEPPTPVFNVTSDGHNDPGGGGGNFRVSYNAVPEPSSILLLGIGSLAVLRLPLRRRSRGI